LLDQLAQLVQLDLLAVKVSKDQLGRKVFKAYRVFKVKLDQLDLQAQLVILARVVRLDLRVQIQPWLVQQDQLASKEYKA
jgi:hypothetical protein